MEVPTFPIVLQSPNDLKHEDSTPSSEYARLTLGTLACNTVTSQPDDLPAATSYYVLVTDIMRIVNATGGRGRDCRAVGRALLVLLRVCCSVLILVDQEGNGRVVVAAATPPLHPGVRATRTHPRAARVGRAI